MNKKTILISAALLAGLGVALGAFGSHALKELLLQNGRTETFETAVRYQLFHALALLIIGLLSEKSNTKELRWAAMAFVAGTILFSGSLYALSLALVKWVVYFTPIGGVLMIAGWGLLLYHFLKMKE